MRSLLKIPVAALIIMSVLSLNLQAQTRHDRLTQLTREFIEQLRTEQFETAASRFDSTISAAMPLDKLRQTWQGVIAQVGAVQEITAITVQPHEQYDIVTATVAFQHISLNVQVTFDPDDKIAGFFLKPVPPPDVWETPGYVRTDSFREEEVSFGLPGWELPGRICIPSGDGPFPALILIHGSGPNDRDETVGPNKPFKDISFGLASRGIAVFSFDKRTKAHGIEFAKLSDYTLDDETVDDAVAAVAFLRNNAAVDSERVFVAGHSLGAIAGPRIAAKAPDLAGLIMMAGAARPLEDVVLDQLEYIDSLSQAAGQPTPYDLDEIKKQVALAKSPDLSTTAEATDLPLGIAASYWLDLRGYRPLEIAAQLNLPLLIMQGARDYQSTTEDFHMWENALAGKSNVTMKLYPGLNHLFMSGEGMATPAEYEQAGHVDNQVIDDLSDWILKH